MTSVEFPLPAPSGWAVRQEIFPDESAIEMIEYDGSRSRFEYSNPVAFSMDSQGVVDLALSEGGSVSEECGEKFTNGLHCRRDAGHRGYHAARTEAEEDAYAARERAINAWEASEPPGKRVDRETDGGAW